MTARQIIHQFLKSNLFDGLYNADDQCGCRIDDLAPCNEFCLNCEPGYIKFSTDSQMDTGWIIGPIKQLPTKTDPETEANES